MYRMIVELDKTSYVEVASRITGSGEELMLALRGLKESGAPSVASANLNTEEVQQLIQALTGWLNKSS